MGSTTELITVSRFQSFTSPSSLELSERTSPSPPPSTASRDVESDGDFGRDEQELSPVDSGIVAWRMLFAAFVFEGLLWGFPLSFGFSGNRYVSVVGTIASGLGYLGAPFIMPFVVGWSICIIGLVLGSFVSTLEALILTQGVAYGIGFLIFYYPILSMVNEYWIARRGMAYGILCGASGVSGAVVPFVLHALLTRYGYRTTLRVVAVALVLLTGPFIPFLKGRLPTSDSASIPKMSWRFLRNPLFWFYSASNILQGFGYFFPGLYLPSYASVLGLGGNDGALLLALMSLSQVGGQFVFGFLSDHKIPLDILACLSTTVAATASLTLWKLSGSTDSLPILIVFALAYGFFAAGYTATWARMSTAIADDVTAVPMVFCLLNFGKGIGNVLAGPIGGLLVFASESSGPPSSSYRWIIIFTGVSMFASSLTISTRYLRHLKTLFIR
ncbi:major facilitator superfamily domain-containing protein [Xylariaceae sp. FL0255]|nr:major facilitator superfamily domain-containing protein [Xylariaceae sp. FL0255]